MLTAGVELLERALGYTLGSLQLVTSEALGRPSPCTAWDLQDLLRHMDDSLLTLHQAIVSGHVELDPARPAGDRPRGARAGVHLVASLRERGCRMIGSWAGAGHPDEIAVADRVLPSPLVAATGAIEVAVHGWDVARACGHDRPVPAALAGELLELSRLLIRDEDRPAHFARPVRVPAAGPGDRLIAFTGRDPR
jgi:uncharacterized protein (TIGR03086 family)